MTIEDKVERLLATLPDDPNEIASRMAQEGCFDLGSNSDCSLSRLIKRRLGLEHVEVGIGICLAQGIKVDLPKACIQFVFQCDLGKYPFLVF